MLLVAVYEAIYIQHLWLRSKALCCGIAVVFSYTRVALTIYGVTTYIIQNPCQSGKQVSNNKCLSQCLSGLLSG